MSEYLVMEENEVLRAKTNNYGTIIENGSKKQDRGSVISFKDISYTVNVRPPGTLCTRTTQKKILQNISGVFKPGLNAILGPTGGGKTSLLDVLAGRKDPSGQEGTVYVNGCLQPKNFKCMTGYVVQDDVVMGTLSVRENFMFSANLRLSSDISMKEKEKRVDDLIVQLGLVHSADSKVGTEFIRGVSGGERKRTNIGMELIVSQSILFLDEPTTGLDASTAKAVVNLLKTLSMKGTTVIFSIHQPRYSIFKLFDTMLLLSLGKTIFHGPADQGLDFFEDIGYKCEEHNNPPDFFLDVINCESSAAKLLNSKPYFKDICNESVKDKDKTYDVKNEEELTDKINQLFEVSGWYKQCRNELENEISRGAVDCGLANERGKYATGPLSQFFYVSQRHLRNSLRNPATLIVQCVVMTIFSVIIGTIYFQVSDVVPEALQNRVGAFFFLIMNTLFSSLSALELFIQERKIFVHESGSGYYRTAPYFLGKVFCDIIPTRCILSPAYCVIIYLMIGLVPSVEKYLIFTLNMILTTMCSCAIGIFISASLKVFAIANLLMSLIFVFMMLFGGFLVNVHTVFVGLGWLKYLSVFRYSLNGLLINEMKGLQLYTEVAFNGTTVKIPVSQAGETFLESLGIAYETSWDLWVNYVALCALALGFFILGYIQMRRIPKWK